MPLVYAGLDKFGQWECFGLVVVCCKRCLQVVGLVGFEE